MSLATMPCGHTLLYRCLDCGKCYQCQHERVFRAKPIFIDPPGYRASMSTLPKPQYAPESHARYGGTWWWRGCTGTSLKPARPS